MEGTHVGREALRRQWIPTDRWQAFRTIRFSDVRNWIVPPTRVNWEVDVFLYCHWMGTHSTDTLTLTYDFMNIDPAKRWIIE
jgi:hypothetical protein